MDDSKLLKIIDRPLQWIFPKNPGQTAGTLRHALEHARAGIVSAPMMCPLLSIEVGADQLVRLLAAEV